MFAFPFLLLPLLQTGDLGPAIKSAQELLATGKPVEAVQILEDAGVAATTQADALLLLGQAQLKATELLMANGELKGLEINDGFLGAAWTLEKAAQIVGSPAETFEHWSEALLNGGDNSNAVRAIEEGLAIHPKDPRLLLQGGRIYISEATRLGNLGKEEKRNRSWGKAEAVFKLAMSVDKKATLACIRLGELMRLKFAATQSNADKKAARDAWGTAIKRNLEEVDLSAMVQWLRSDAVPLLDQIISKKGADPNLIWYQGYAEYLEFPREWKSVRLYFEEVLKLKPELTNAWFFLAQGAMDEGARLDAAGDSSRASKAFVYSGQGWAKYFQDNGATYATSSRALADGGNQVVGQMKWLAGLLAARRESGVALELLYWASTVQEKDAELWNNIALLERDFGKLDKALAAYATAGKLAPSDPQVLNDWAVVLHYYLKKDDQQAINLYQKAISLAEPLLASGELQGEEKQRIQTALRDAQNNLRKLEKGNRKNQ